MIVSVLLSLHTAGYVQLRLKWSFPLVVEVAYKVTTSAGTFSRPSNQSTARATRTEDYSVGLDETDFAAGVGHCLSSYREGDGLEGDGLEGDGL